MKGERLYRDLYQYMRECASMWTLMDEFVGTHEEPTVTGEELLNMAAMVGSDFYFARLIRQQLNEYNNITQICFSGLSDAEKQLVARVNNFYREEKIHPVDFDVLVIPQAEDNFDSSIMEVPENGGPIIPEATVKFCSAPALYTAKGECEKKAIVITV